MDERIDIEISDKVDGNISKKLRQIATDSLAAESAVKKLKAQLTGFNSSAIDRLQKAADASALSVAKLAVQQQRLSTESARTATATAQAAAAQDRAAMAAMRLQQAQTKAAAAGGSMARDADALRAALYPLEAAQAAHNKEVQHALTLYKAGAINVKTYTDAVNAAGSKLDNFKAGAAGGAKGAAEFGKQTGLARSHLLNLGFQLQDIGVSLAGGQNPLLVMAQQGSQISGIAAQAGVGMGAMARAAAAMLVPFLPLVVAVGAVVAGFKLVSSEAEKTAGLKAYAESLGLTEKEIKKMDLASVSMGDTLKGLWTTISEATGAGDYFSGLADSAVKAFKNIIGYASSAMSAVVGVFSGVYATIVEIWRRLPVSFKRPIVEAVNTALGYFEKLANGTIDSVNFIIGALNKISAVKIDPFKNIQISKVSTDFAESSGADLGTVFQTAYQDSFKKNQAAQSSFLANWVKNTSSAARARVKKAAEDVGAADRGKGGKDNAAAAAESRARALARVNGELDKQINGFGLLKPVREAQQALDQIEINLASKKIKMTEDERASIKKKIDTIEQQKAVQSAFDGIYEASSGPLREYNAHIEAAGKLLKMGAISQDFYTTSVQNATDKYKEATDAGVKYSKDIEEQTALFGKFGSALEVAQQMQQYLNDAQSKGLAISPAQKKAMEDELTLLQQKKALNDSMSQIYGATVGQRQQGSTQIDALSQMKGVSGFGAGDQARQTDEILKGMGIDTAVMQTGIDAQLAIQQEYYSKLEQLKARGLITENEFSNARIQIAQAENKIKLQATDKFLTQVSSLQSSSVKGMAMLGKTAAITQAIINTYEGATKALAQGGIYGSAMAAAVVASGMVQVQQIRSQGFKTGGYTGDYGVNEVAGVVHGKEYVMNAEATAKHRSTLEAMNSGQDVGSAAGGNITISHNPTYNIDSRSDRAAILSDIDRANKRSNAELVDTLYRKKLIG